MNITNENLSLMTFGGVGAIGANLCGYKYKDKYLIVDMGIGFSDEVPSFQNKVIVPNIDFLEKNRDDILGIVITHGHDDHIAAIPFLWDKLKVKIYSTLLPAELIKKKTERADIKEAIEILPQGTWTSLDPFKFKFINITHSIPESSAIAIRTDRDTVIHTGDWKLDPNPIIGQTTDEKSFKELGQEGVTALVCDSTNILRSHNDRNMRSISSVIPDLNKIVQNAKNKNVFFTCISTNIALLKICYDIAVKNNRQLCLVGRSLMRAHEAVTQTGYWNPEDKVLLEEEGANAQPGSILYICTGSQGERGSSMERISRRDKTRKVSIESGDIAIFAARTIIGNEKPVNEIINRLTEMNVEVIFNSPENHILVSGHPVQEDVDLMYQWTKPQCVIPVHGEPQHLIYHSKFAKSKGIKSIYFKNGQEIEITKDGPRKISDFFASESVVDGNTLLDIKGNAVKEKRNLVNGVIIAIISHKRTRVDTIGLVDKPSSDSSKLENEISELVESTLQNLSQDKKQTFQSVRYHLYQRISSWIYEKQSRRPMIKIYINRNLKKT